MRMLLKQLGNIPWRALQYPLPIAILLIALLWGGVFEVVHLIENTKRKDAHQDASNLARVFEEHVGRAVRETDKTLLFLRAVYESKPGEFSLSRWTNDAEFKSELLVQFALIDQNGIMVESNVGRADKRIDLSDREHFKIHVSSNSDALFISKPVLGRASGKWSIQLSRRIRSTDGKFAGVLVGSIDPSFLSKFYDGIDLGQNGATTLVGFDGVIRARGGAVSDVLGRSIYSSKVFDLLKAATEGIYAEKDPIDSEPRLIGYRLVKGFPLLVLVGISEREIVAQSRFSIEVCIFVGTCLTVLIVFLILAMYRKFRLDAEVAVLAAERDKSKAENKAKSTFLAVMSHEIRTPMNAILGLSSSLLNKKLDKESHSFVKLINEEGDRLLVILNDILDYSKMESGKLHFERMTFTPAELVAGVVDIAGPRGRAKGLIIENKTSLDMPPGLVGDAGRLRQVLLNLVSNAIKFTPSGKVSIETRCLAVHDNRATIEWTVNDTGIGIAPESVANLFGDFVQADASISRSFGGSGLGLSICRRIVLQMGGSIDIQSVPGSGTTVSFQVELPIGTPVPVQDDFVDHSRQMFSSFISAKGRKLRFLIVDDSPTNLLVASEMLQEFNIVVDTAGDGIEAVTAASKFRFDLIFMDMRMPEMDGIQATKAIRTSGGLNATVPIIAFTANAFSEDVAACIDAGMNGFLTKPVRKNLMLDEVFRVLNSDCSSPESYGPPSLSSLNVAHPRSEAMKGFDQDALADLVAALGRDRTLEAVRRFKVEAADRIDKIRSLSTGINKAVLTREAHSIKGISATFGLSELSELASLLERSAPTASASELATYVERIEASFSHGKDRLAQCELLAA